MGKLVRFIYNRCDLILGQSKSFKVGIQEYCDDMSKYDYFPSWAENIFNNNKAIPSPLIPCIDGCFNIVFAGNIGDAQDFPSILNAAEKLKANKYIKWYIVGDGRALPMVKEQIINKKLEDCVILLGRYPLEQMPSFYLCASALLVTLKESPIFAMTIPSKTQTYMMAGKPILAMLDGEGSNIIKESNCGFVSASGDFNSLAENIIKMQSLKTKELETLGQNGKAYALKEFNREALVEKLIAWMNERAIK